jgi:UDP-N-acetylmuramate dehydrogenase
VTAGSPADANVSDLLPNGVQRGVALARFSTLKCGGPAELFARVGDAAQLVGLLAWADSRKVAVSVVGSGSNLLIADEGVAGLVLKLDRELARIRADGSVLVCGAGARLPSVAARAAREGLSGIEFGVNIPGSVGGAVRMNAGAYGGELQHILAWVDVATAAGVQRRTAADLGMAYRSSNLGSGHVVSEAAFALEPAPPESVRATIATMRASRQQAQPSGIKTFGSTFKNPDAAALRAAGNAAAGQTAGQLLEAAGCRGLQVGRARFSPEHANFVENTGGATTADAVALMAEGRRRVSEAFGIALEPEVQLLGPVRFPW